ncbi:MAG: glycosyltransferase family 2 protein [Anaerolineae bacterium]
MMTYPKVSIIILNWNGLEDTVECLESLKKITYPNYEVIVVDNGSQGDDVRALRERYRDYIHIIQNEKNYGFARGNNVGIRYALDKGTDYVLLLNNDTVVAPDFLDVLVGAAQSDERIGIACPRIYRYSQPEKVCFDGGARVHLWWGTVTERLRPGSEPAALDTEFAIGTAMLIRRKTLEQTGLLPEEYFFGAEDWDYSLNALRHNLRIVVARRAVVWHKVGGIAGPTMGRPRLAYKNYEGWQILRRKYLSTPAYVLSTVCVLARASFVSVSTLLCYVWRRDFRSAAIFLRSMKAALKGLVAGSLYRKPGGSP